MLNHHKHTTRFFRRILAVLLCALCLMPYAFSGEENEIPFFTEQQEINEHNVPASVFRQILTREKKIVRKFGEFSIVDNVSTGRKLADNLTGSVKSTFDNLVAAEIKHVDDGNSIKFLDSEGNEIAIIVDNNFIPKKWTLRRINGGELISQTEAGYYLIKNGDKYAFELGYKEGRVLSADEVNAYHKGIGNHEPYKAGTVVNERSLDVGDKVYIVENAIEKSSGLKSPNPGGWGSKNVITTERELREYLAVLEEWKKANGIHDPLVVREYTVKSPLRVRDGVVGPQMGVLPDGSYKVYYGGEHQYEFIDFLGNGNWDNYLTPNATQVLNLNK